MYLGCTNGKQQVRRLTRQLGVPDMADLKYVDALTLALAVLAHHNEDCVDVGGQPSLRDAAAAFLNSARTGGVALALTLAQSPQPTMAISEGLFGSVHAAVPHLPSTGTTDHFYMERSFTVGVQSQTDLERNGVRCRSLTPFAFPVTNPQPKQNGTSWG